MGNEQTKTVLEESGEPITYFAINIKQPDKLHILPSDAALSAAVVRALEPHCSIVERGATSPSTYTVTLAGQPFATTRYQGIDISIYRVISGSCKIVGA